MTREELKRKEAELAAESLRRKKETLSRFQNELRTLTERNETRAGKGQPSRDLDQIRWLELKIKKIKRLLD
jgi:hypothetical protein